MFEDFNEIPPSAPYVFEKMPWEAHQHYIAPPNWPGDFGGKSLRELYAGDPKPDVRKKKEE